MTDKTKPVMGSRGDHTAESNLSRLRVRLLASPEMREALYGLAELSSKVDEATDGIPRGLAEEDLRGWATEARESGRRMNAYHARRDELHDRCDGIFTLRQLDTLAARLCEDDRPRELRFAPPPCTEGFTTGRHCARARGMTDNAIDLEVAWVIERLKDPDLNVTHADALVDPSHRSKRPGAWVRQLRKRWRALLTDEARDELSAVRRRISSRRSAS